MINHNIYGLFKSRFPANMDQSFLRGENGENLTYAELDHKSGQMAAWLKSKNIAKGDRILVQVEKSPMSVVFYLACLRIGAVYLPLNTAYTQKEVRYFIEDSRPELIVINSFNTNDYSDLLQYLYTLDEDGSLIKQSMCTQALEEIEQMEVDDLAALLYTSGTTGRSKGAMLSHGNLASNALTLHKLWEWQQGDILLHALPIFHVHGLFVALHCALLNASSIWFLPKLDVEALIRLLPKSTVLMGVPTFYTRLLDHPDFSRELCSNMRLFISGSAPLLPETFEKFSERTGHRILERYGMTEGGMITSNPYEGDRVAGTVGFALPEVTVRVCDEDGIMLPRGEIGVLEYRGPNLFKGYWRMPDKTAEEMRPDGYFISGDLAVQNAEGRICIVGRAKDLIISGGFNIYPKEVESAIDLIKGVKESAVIGVAHSDFGEAVVAVVVLDAPDALTESNILKALKDDLAKFKQPKKIIFRHSLPRNTMGKVQKNIVRQEMKSLFT